MKKNLILVLLLSISTFYTSFSQTKLSYPDITNPIIKLIIPESTWEATLENNLLSIVPKDSGESARLITLLWASDKPMAENAMEVIVNDAFDVIESLLVDITWQEEMSEFENNNISFTALDGYGYYVNEDGSKIGMSTSVMILIPDDINILTLVFFGSDEAFTKWEKEIFDIILSIEPGK